jgi:periplasmic protein TonB
MSTNENKTAGVKYGSMEEIVFAKRNKEYGAYDIRKKYSKYVILSFFIAIFIVAGGLAKPVYESYKLKGKKLKKIEKTVTMDLENLDKEEAPPPPPPPPPAAIEQQVKFVAPVVVDTVKEEVVFATADDMVDNAANEAPPEEIRIVEQTTQEIEEVKEEGVWFVEENASFQGGDINTFNTWVKEHVSYPYEATEAGVFGKVIVQFSVNREGKVVDVKVIKSVHPSLDNEAVRVIQSSPRWTPAKQSGNAVKQNFVIPIAFQLQ